MFVWSLTRPYDCRIVKADPGVEIPWSEVESGHWRAVCQCGVEDRYEEPADRRARLDPLDPSTFHHAGQCEHRDTTDPVLLGAILKVRDGAGGTTGGWSAAPATPPGRFRTTPPRRTSVDTELPRADPTGCWPWLFGSRPG
jgi:hypothetical protein